MICFDPLHAQSTAVLQNTFGSRVCRHFFHLACVESLRNRECPLCRAEFALVQVVPHPTKNPRGFFTVLDVDGSASLSREEVIEGLKVTCDRASSMADRVNHVV